MASTAGDVSLDITAQLTGIDQAIKELNDKISAGSKKSGKNLEDNLNGSLNNVTKTIRENLGKVLGGLSFAYIGYKLGGEIKKGIQDAIDGEISTKRLENSLLNVGITSSKVRKDILDFADSFKFISSIDDDAITNKFTIASGAGASVEQYKKIVTASIGFANATGESFDGAFDKITRTLSGSAGRIGLTVAGFNSLTEAQLKAGKGIDFLAERYGSFAGQEVTTLGGALKILDISTNKIFEAFGALLTSSPSLVALVKTLSDEFFGLAENIETVSKQGDAFTGIIESSFTLFSFMERLVGIVQAFGGAFLIAMGGITASITLPLALIGKLVELFGGLLEGIGSLTKTEGLRSFGESLKYAGENAKQFLLDTTGAFLGKGIGNIANGFRKTFSDETNIDDLQKKFSANLEKMKINKENFDKNFKDSGSTVSTISNKINQTVSTSVILPKKEFIEQDLSAVLASVNPSPIRVEFETGSFGAVESTLGAFSTSYGEFGNSILNTNSLLNNSINGITQSFKDGSTEAINATRATAEEVSKGTTTEQLDQQTKKVEDLAKQMGSTVKSAIGGAISGGVQKLVSGLIKGGLNFKDFAGFVFDLLGDMAIQMGTFAITAGIAIESIGNLHGAKAVIAGIALVALGTIIKSFLGGGSGGGSSAGAGAQTASTGASGGGGLVATDTATTEVAQTQERKVGQTVNIEVQGNMIDDNNKFAKFVADTLNRGFETEDLRLINGIVA